MLSQTISSLSEGETSIISRKLYTYDLYGSSVLLVFDLDKDFSIDFQGPDRIIRSESGYFLNDCAIWRETKKFLYPEEQGTNVLFIGASREKITGLGDFVAFSESEGAHKNIVVKTTAIDRLSGIKITSTLSSHSIQPELHQMAYGLLHEMISDTMVTNRFEYDGLNRQTSSINGRGNVTALTYDSFGYVIHTQDNSTNLFTYVYDKFGRLIKHIDPLNHIVDVKYDVRGNIIGLHGATYSVWYEYDIEGRMTAMATTRDVSLDPATVNSLDHPSLDVTRWIYDEATGLLVQKRYADGKGPSFSYTPDGKLSSRTWARGVVTLYDYDQAGQLSGVKYSDATPDVLYEYNRIGQMQSAVSAGVATNRFHYSSGFFDLISEEQNGCSISYRFNAIGRPSGLSIDSDYSMDNVYDSMGRISKNTVTAGDLSITNWYEYVQGTELIGASTTSLGHSSTSGYQHQRNSVASITNSFRSVMQSAFDYQSDEVQRTDRRIDTWPGAPVETNSFVYNQRSEVIGERNGSIILTYGYDPIGNRVSTTNNSLGMSWISTGLNQYANASNSILASSFFAYDDDGNMITNGCYSYEWDGENRLRSIFSNGVFLISYSYDHLSRRVRKQAENGVDSLYYDGWNLIREIQHSHKEVSMVSTNSYFWGVDLSGVPHKAGGIGGLIAIFLGNNVFCPMFDGHGNVVGYVDDKGACTTRYEYDSYGRLLAQEGALVDKMSYRFSTKYHDAETGLYYFGYRFYSPELGRWLNRDPLGEEGGQNLYAFVRNSPTLFVDPFGLEDDGKKKQCCCNGQSFATMNQCCNVGPEGGKITRAQPTCTLKIVVSHDTTTDKCRMEETIRASVLNNITRLGFVSCYAKKTNLALANSPDSCCLFYPNSDREDVKLYMDLGKKNPSDVKTALAGFLKEVDAAKAEMKSLCKASNTTGTCCDKVKLVITGGDQDGRTWISYYQKEVTEAANFQLDCRRSIDSQEKGFNSKSTPLSPEDLCASRGGEWK